MRKLLSSKALAAVALIASPASATTYVITYTGTVATSTADTGGFFGNVNASLTGLNFVATFMADDTTPGALFATNAEFTSLYGGPGFPDPGPPPPIFPGTSKSPVSATLTINGITQRLADINRYIGTVQKRDNSVFPGQDSLSTQIDERVLGANNVNTRYLQVGVFSSVNNLFTTSGFGESIDRTLLAGDQFNSFFSLSNVAQGGSLGSVSGTFNVARVKFLTLNAVAVPEPASWAFMIVGFGMVGGMVRHRRRNPQPATG